MAKLHGEHRSDGGSRAAFKQQNDLCRHPVEAQQCKNSHTDRRDQHHPESGQLPDVPVAHDALQVTGCDQHSGDEHRKRGVHPAQQVDGLGDEVGNGDLKQIDRQTHHHGVEHRGVQQAAGDLLWVGAAAYHAVPHGPEQNVEHRDIGTGVEQTFRAKEGGDQRETHIRRVGKDAGKPKDRRTAILPASRQQQRDRRADQDGEDAHPKGRQQVVQDLLAELHHIGVDDHRRNDQIEQEVREGLLALLLQHTGFNGHKAATDEQKQDDDLLRGDKSQFHKSTS